MKKILLICALALCSGCEIFGDEKPTDELQAKRHLWEQASYSDYSYDVFVGCFCPFEGIFPATIVVRDDTIASAITIHNNTPVPADQLEAVPTIPRLFDILEDAIEEADEIDIEYDTMVGYPVKASIDYYADAVDDEVFYEISNLAPLEN